MTVRSVKRMSLTFALLLTTYLFSIVTAKVTAKEHCQHTNDRGTTTWAFCDDDEECCERNGSAACCEEDGNPVCCGESSFIPSNWRWITAAVIILISVILICCCLCYCKRNCCRSDRHDSSSSGRRTRNSPFRNPTATQTVRRVATPPATNGTVGMVEITSCNSASPRNSDCGSNNSEPALYSHDDAPPSYYELDLCT